jgi:hypothetical protein
MGSLTKGMIGKEDFSIQTNTAVAETFNRLTSTGSTMSLTKIPDIWNGTGSPKVHHILDVHDVRYYGAKGDGVTDDTIAIQSAFAAATLAGINYTCFATNSVYAVPEVFFPAGHYIISDSINPGYVVIIKGERSIIRCTNAAKDIFTFTNGYVVTISELTFIGGRSHITFTNANLGPSELYIDKCEFTWGNTKPVFVVTLTAPATQMSLQVVVTNSKFLYNYQMMENVLGADFVFRDCEFIGTNPIAAVGQFINKSNLLLDRWQGAPSAGACPAAARWVDNYYWFHTIHSRFGAEGSGMPIVYNYEGPDGVYAGGVGSWGNGKVSIENSTITACGASAVENSLIRFVTDIPQDITIRNNNYVTTDNVAFFDTDINIATYLNALDAFVVIRINVEHNASIPQMEGMGFPTALVTTNTKQVQVLSDIPLPAVTFTDGDATPSIGNREFFVTANTAPTTITNFDDGKVGQKILVRFGDAVTTIDFGTRIASNLQGNSEDDWTPTLGDFMTCTYDGTYWYCTIVDAT